MSPASPKVGKPLENKLPANRAWCKIRRVLIDEIVFRENWVKTLRTTALATRRVAVCMVMSSLALAKIGYPLRDQLTAQHHPPR